MLCINCGYENPREHRYCGMCGTPFPYRALTVPGAQSTLDFISTTVDVAPAVVAEPKRPAAVETEPAVTEAVATDLRVAEPSAEPVVIPTPEMRDLPEQQTVVQQAAGASEPAIGVEETTRQETLASVPEAEAPPAESVPIEPAEIFATEAPPFVVAEIATKAREAAEPPPPVEEPEQPREPPAREPEPKEPEIREPEPEAPEVIREPPPAPERGPTTPPRGASASAPITPTPSASRPIPPRVVVMPLRPETHEARIVAPQDMAKIHPPPDSLPISSPPASSGMPTFKEISEASGPPAISPFEPPTEGRTAEDRELKEFVANFRWTPPAETADELTMRSEVPVIDKEAPAEFHHPSFDDDVAPPPEAGPHPTGQEFYEPDGTAPRPRFLDVEEHSDGQPVASGKSLIGLDEAPTQVPPAGLAGVSKRRGWLWGSILALVAIFGGLGYLEGRAQSTHEFRGPVQIVREEYDKLRERLLTKVEPTAAAPETKQPETQKPGESQTQPETSAQPATTQPDPAQQTQPEASLPATSAQPQENAAAGASQPTQNGAGTTAAADTTPAKAVDAPPTKPSSSKPQPGQQELTKALNASDSAAAAAWLWKATSRGNPEAPVRLADMYIKGNGVTKSCEQALVLLRSAAIKENAPARNRLAALYANGTCVTRDRVKAYQLMSSALAADPTSEWAKENQQQLWNQMTAEQRAEAQKVH